MDNAKFCIEGSVLNAHNPISHHLRESTKFLHPSLSSVKLVGNRKKESFEESKIERRSPIVM